MHPDVGKQLETSGLKVGGYGSWQVLKKTLVKRGFKVGNGKLLLGAKEVVPTEQWDDLVLSAYKQLQTDGSPAPGLLPSQIHKKLAQSVCTESRQHGLGLADITAIISAQPHVYGGQGGNTEPARLPKQRAPAILPHETECHFFLEAPADSVVMLHVAGEVHGCWVLLWGAC